MTQGAQVVELGIGPDTGAPLVSTVFCSGGPSVSLSGRAACLHTLYMEWFPEGSFLPLGNLGLNLEQGLDR